MKDTRINFETAKLAKEKGFDIKTKYSWYVPDNSKPIIEKHKPDGLYYLSCPTQSLLAKWLREEHNLYTESQMYIEEGLYKFKYVIKSDFEYDLIILKEKYNFSTYEEAREIVLQEALKLI